MNRSLRTLVQAAILAPSGDNTQPWRFVIDSDRNAISLLLDPSRDPSPMNAGQRMARIALGCALENMLQTADRNGWTYTLHESTDERPSSLTLADTGNQAGEIDPTTKLRTTNRRIYEPQGIREGGIEHLTKLTPDFTGIQTVWITDGNLMRTFADLIGRADALMFGAKQVRDAFLKNVRFDAPVTAEVEEGLSLGSLEASAFERLALRIMARTPNALLKLGGASRVFASAARQRVQSSTGICVITSTSDSRASEINVGRAMQRAWLALTAEGLAVQPMMSFSVLQNIRDNAPKQLLETVGSQLTESLLNEFYELMETFSEGRPNALLRFGNAPAPTSRVGRLPVDVVVETSAPKET